MVGLLVMIGGLILKSEILKRAAYGIFILGAFTAIAAFLTGEGAEEVVEEIQGIDEKMIKIHEEVAEIFAILIYVLGGLSLIGLWANWKNKSYSSFISYVVVAFSFVVFFYAKQTGTTGGEIRHTEIRANTLESNNDINTSTELERNED
jgi:FtsH-binding integral membrane protein